ncbi:MAG: RadC family protein [Thermodesulfobacteriota bacterium]
MEKKGAGHRERLRNKFRKRGIEALNNDEVLEILLTLGTPRRDCKEMSRSLLKKFGSLPAIFDSAPGELEDIKGIGPQNSFALHFIQAVARRYLYQRLQGKHYLSSSREVADYLNHSMRHLKKEVFKVILLDASLAIIDTKTLFEGSLSKNTVYPRELVKLALEYHAAALIISHNHPSGSQEPSPEDRKLTRHLYLACSMIDISLLDHLIIGREDTPYSFADHGDMAEIKRECQNII